MRLALAPGSSTKQASGHDGSQLRIMTDSRFQFRLDETLVVAYGFAACGSFQA